MRNRETAGTVDNTVILAVLILEFICMRVLVNVALACSVFARATYLKFRVN